jgi:hypothetical protein
MQSFELTDYYLTKTLRCLIPLLLMPIVDTRALPNNELTAEQNQIDWNCKVKYHGTELWARSICFNLLYLIAKLFTGTLKGTHKQVSWTGHGLWIPAIKKPWLYFQSYWFTKELTAITLHQVCIWKVIWSGHRSSYDSSDDSNPLQFLFISNPKQTYPQ